jgi:hypothetical protein
MLNCINISYTRKLPTYKFYILIFQVEDGLFKQVVLGIQIQSLKLDFRIYWPEISKLEYLHRFY